MRHGSCGAIPPLLSELSNPHFCQTQLAASPGTPTPQAASHRAMPRATPPLHLAIQSIPIQLQFHRPWRITPWSGTSSSACALPSRRISAKEASFAAMPVRIQSTTSATFSFTFSFSAMSVAIRASHPSAANLAARLELHQLPHSHTHRLGNAYLNLRLVRELEALEARHCAAIHHLVVTPVAAAHVLPVAGASIHPTWFHPSFVHRLTKRTVDGSLPAVSGQRGAIVPCLASSLHQQACRLVHPGPSLNIGSTLDHGAFGPKDGALAVMVAGAIDTIPMSKPSASSLRAASLGTIAPCPLFSISAYRAASAGDARDRWVSSRPLECCCVQSASVSTLSSTSIARPSMTEFLDEHTAHAGFTEPSLILCRQNSCNHLTETDREQSTLAQATARDTVT